MNNCSFIGRLTSDVELKQTPNGISVCSFQLAVDRPNVKDTTDFINFVAWRGTAEFISLYFKKGQKVAVTGCLTSRKYQDKDNKNRTVFEVVVDRAEFCESKNKEEAAQDCEDQAHFEEVKSDDGLPF